MSAGLTLTRKIYHFRLFAFASNGFSVPFYALTKIALAFTESTPVWLIAWIMYQ